MYRQLTQGAENAKLTDIRERVTATIVALDILIDVVINAIY